MDYLKNFYKYKISIGIFFYFIFSWVLCFKMISPGYVGVVIDMLGDGKGVQEKELHVGIHWIAPWKNVYQFPIFEQNDTWEGDSEGFNFQTCEGMGCTRRYRNYLSFET